MAEISPWVSLMKPSPTLALKDELDALIAAGKKLHDFGVGEMNPEIPLPDVIKQRMIKALQDNETGYSPAAGDAELIEAIREDMRRFGVYPSYEKECIVVSAGPKDSLYKVMATVLHPSLPRHRVVVFAPTYESFENVPVLLTGLPPIICPTSADFLPDLAALATILTTDNTVRMIIVNSPNNPTGRAYPTSLLEEMARLVAAQPGVLVLADEVYRTIQYDTKDGEFASIAKFIPDQTVVVGGMSKEVSGTGIRVGFAAGPAAILRAVAKVQGNTQSCVNLPAQKAYAAFLRADADFHMRYALRDAMAARRTIFFDAVAQYPVLSKLRGLRPEGAFYFFPDVTPFLPTTDPTTKQPIETDKDLVAYLIRSRGVAVLPGSLFQCPGHIRMAYSRSEAMIREGVAALADALGHLSPPPC